MSEAKIANAPTKETSDCSPSFVLGNSFVSATYQSLVPFALFERSVPSEPLTSAVVEQLAKISLSYSLRLLM